MTYSSVEEGHHPIDAKPVTRWQANACCDELPAYQEIGQRVPSAIDHNDLSKPIVTPALGGLRAARDRVVNGVPDRRQQ